MSKVNHRGVSVVMPAYNRVDVAPRAVESVLGQTYGPLELIAVDDGSTDGTFEYLASLRDPRVTVVRHPRNLGANAARNAGIHRAVHPWIAFMDSDDRWRPDKLEMQLTALAEQGDAAGLVFSPFRRIHGEQVTIVGAELVGRPMAEIRLRLLRGSAIGTPTVVARRELLDSVGGFDPALPRLQEWDLWIRLMDKTRFIGVPTPLVDAYVSKGGISTDQQALVAAHRYLFEKHRSAFQKAGRDVYAGRLSNLAHLELMAQNHLVAKRLFRRALRSRFHWRILRRAIVAHLSPRLYVRLATRARDRTKATRG